MSRRQSPLVHRNIVMMDVKIEMVKGSDDEITVKEKGNTKFCISCKR
ncbi:20506_t:CDS:2 [Rhizophagus irregularis]|nr:20506_t:CDS:2 [Rhizophagus irregularis]